MRIFGFFTKQKSRAEPTFYNVVLHHDNGHELTLQNVSSESVGFIRENLGRDILYSQKDIVVNLSKFSIAQMDNNKPNTAKNKIKGETKNGR